jgi:hypothetical protein
MLIDAAVEKAELLTGRSLLTQTRDLKLADFPDRDTIELPGAPIASVTSVGYYDLNNAAQTLTLTTQYLAFTGANIGAVYLPNGGTWPSTYDRLDAATIRYVSGWTSAASVPSAIRAWRPCCRRTARACPPSNI